MSITHEDLRTALGRKYDASIDYIVVEAGPVLKAKLNDGYRVAGQLADEISHRDVTLYILSPPTPKKRSLFRGLFSRLGD